ncbi:hypothetical protein FGO68_gene14796 [Halteria grandinella]|uniref:Uncharacterized protein n=1 Tax=Halteria grandinella TaxID=5974 RepID=A0A8J8T7F6_HALGN|nr:hypothetical protein FGO68_gene14796 [Halteria grandinella]
MLLTTLFKAKAQHQEPYLQEERSSSRGASSNGQSSLRDRSRSKHPAEESLKGRTEESSIGSSNGSSIRGVIKQKAHQKQEHKGQQFLLVPQSASYKSSQRKSNHSQDSSDSQFGSSQEQMKGVSLYKPSLFKNHKQNGRESQQRLKEAAKNHRANMAPQQFQIDESQSLHQQSYIPQKLRLASPPSGFFSKGGILEIHSQRRKSTPLTIFASNVRKCSSPQINIEPATDDHHQISIHAPDQNNLLLSQQRMRSNLSRQSRDLQSELMGRTSSCNFLQREDSLNKELLSNLASSSSKRRFSNVLLNQQSSIKQIRTPLNLFRMSIKRTGILKQVINPISKDLTSVTGSQENFAKRQNRQGQMDEAKQGEPSLLINQGMDPLRNQYVKQLKIEHNFSPRTAAELNNLIDNNMDESSSGGDDYKTRLNRLKLYPGKQAQCYNKQTLTGKAAFFEMSTNRTIQMCRKFKSRSLVRLVLEPAEFARTFGNREASFRPVGASGGLNVPQNSTSCGILS